MQHDRREELAGTALRHARRFLHRWRDAVTRSERDDLVQDVAVAAWRCAGLVRDGACFPAVVRTISRRLRWRALERLRCDPLADVGDAVAVPAPLLDAGVRICGEVVPMAWLLEHLDAALDSVGRLNRLLLLAFYEGFSCAELALRFQLREPAIKVRLYRSRRRLRQEFEVRSRAAGFLVD